MAGLQLAALELLGPLVAHGQAHADEVGLVVGAHPQNIKGALVKLLGRGSSGAEGLYVRWLAGTTVSNDTALQFSNESVPPSAGGTTTQWHGHGIVRWMNQEEW